jgi:hypothetical protein
VPESPERRADCGVENPELNDGLRALFLPQYCHARGLAGGVNVDAFCALLSDLHERDLPNVEKSTCPRPGFRTEGAGEAREPGPIPAEHLGQPPNSQGRDDSLTISAC